MTHTQLLEVEAALTNVFTSTAFKRITFYFHYLYRECPILITVLAQPQQRWGAQLYSMKKVVHILEKNVALHFQAKVRKTITIGI